MFFFTDDHYIKDCPTNGDPAYDNYGRPPAKRVHVSPFVPHLNYGVAPSVVPSTFPVYNQNRPFLNSNVAQGYLNLHKGLSPLNSIPAQGCK